MTTIRDELHQIYNLIGTSIIEHTINVFFLLIGLTVLSCSQQTEKILPMEIALTESVYASATIQPDSLYKVYAVVSGILETNLVKEGDLVSENQQLFQIMNTAPKLNTENAKFNLELAQENYNGNAAILNSIKDEIASAQLKLANDSINYFRQKNLWNQHIGSKQEYETKKLNYELATNQLKRLQANYKQTKNQLETAVKQAKNNYETSSVLTKDFTVKSKINGKVYALYKEPGEIISSMEPLASVGSEERFIIKLLVDEVDIVRISIGQEVLLNLEAYNEKVFKATISKIYPQKDERNQTFTVEAEFVNQPEILYPGLSGEANIIIAKKEKVLAIPKTFLIDRDKVKTDEGLIPVKTGVQNMDYVEILSGISKDTYIYNQN